MYQPERILRRRRFWRRFRLYFSLLILGWILIGLFAFLLHSPFFRIGKIKIEGRQRLNEAEIVSLARQDVLDDSWRRLLGPRHWFSWQEGIFVPKNKFLAQLTIDKDLWRRELKLTVKERQPYVIWCENDDCWAVDEEGAAFERIPAAAAGADAKPILVRANGKIEAARVRFWPHLKKIITALKTEGNGEYWVDLELQEARTGLIQGPELFFGLRFDPALSLSALEQMKIRPEFQKWEYLDFRVENRIYYR